MGLNEEDVHHSLAEVADATASQDFARVAPLVANDAICRFTDCDFAGLAALRRAFEKTWASFPDDRWELTNPRIVSLGASSAVVTYDSRWTATVDDVAKSSAGRGTSVIARINGTLKIVLEHLSH